MEYKEVILSLGSNLGNRLTFLQNAIRELKKLNHTDFKTSSIYESEAWGFETEHSFLNCCVYFISNLSAVSIFEIIQDIEKKIGRKAKTQDQNYESREIDIDILFFGDEVHDTTDLKIPHPRLCERNFVLVPLVDICPDWIDPISKKSSTQLLKECGDEGEIKLFRE